MRTHVSDTPRIPGEVAYVWWTTREMAQHAGGVSEEQVRRWIRGGQLRALNIAAGKRRAEYRIRPEWGQQFIDEVLAA